METAVQAKVIDAAGVIIGYLWIVVKHGSMGLFCCAIASRKGLSKPLWFFIGGCFGLLALLAVLVAPRRRSPVPGESMPPDGGIAA